MIRAYTDEIKQLSRITTDEHDEYIELYSEVCFDWLKAYCNNDFKDGIPRAVLLFVAKAINFNMQPVGLKSRSMGTVSYTYSTEYPESMLSLLTPYRRLKFHVL